LKKPPKIRSAKSRSRRVRKAPDMSAFQKKVMRGYDRAAGKVRKFKDRMTRSNKDV
jgi:hypothetical protein